jgi:hypothetical protein
MRDKRDIGIRSGYPAAAIIDGEYKNLPVFFNVRAHKQSLTRYPYRSQSSPEEANFETVCGGDAAPLLEKL